MPLDQNLHQTVTRFGCVGFSMYYCGFSAPQMRQFCLFTYPPISKWVSSEKMSRSHTNLAKLKLLWWSISFNSWTNRKFVSMMSPKCSIVENEMFKWWWRFKHTFCHSSNIIGCTHSFWLFTLWFIDEDASFFHFFHNITNARSWRCVSSSKFCTQFSHTFCNITMVFKVMSQHFPALFKRIHNHIRSAER